MKRTKGNAWLIYAAAGLVAEVAVALIVASILGGRDGQAVWVAAGLAYAVQLGAFALLLFMRDQPNLFLSAWLGGMVLRFGVLAVCAWWLSRSDVLPRSTLLLSYVGFAFLLLLLEPVFVRWGDGARIQH